MAVGTTHSYCIAAVSTVGYGREGYISGNLSSACVTVVVQWESILTGRVALSEDSGGLPVSGACLQYRVSWSVKFADETLSAVILPVKRTVTCRWHRCDHHLQLPVGQLGWICQHEC